MKIFKTIKGEGQGIGVLWGIITLALILLVSGLILAFGADITQDIQADLVTNTAGCNSTNVSGCGTAYSVASETLIAQNGVSEKQDTLATIGVAFFIIALMMSVVAGILAYQKFMS